MAAFLLPAGAAFAMHPYTLRDNRDFTTPDLLHAASGGSGRGRVDNMRMTIWPSPNGHGSTPYVVFRWQYTLESGAAFNACDRRLLIYLRSVHTDGTRSAWTGYFGYAESFCAPSNFGVIDLGLQSVAQPSNLDYYEYEMRDHPSWVPSGGTQRVYARGEAREVPPVPDVPTWNGVTTTSGGKLLTFNMLAALARDAGWSGSDAVTATAVGMAESSGRTKAVSYTGCCHGLWQVNTDVHPYTPEQMYDPVQNAAAAHSIYSAAGSWEPWEAFTNGAYSQYVAEAEVAVDRQEACGNCALDDVASAPSSSSATVTVQWAQPGTVGVTSFVLERQEAGGGWSELATLAGDVRRYTDQDVAQGTVYDYRIKACNGQGCSAWSSTATLTAATADPGGSITNNDPNSPPGGESNDPEYGQSVSCGWNVFCLIKAALLWAFKPGETTRTAWGGFWELVQTKPPMSVVLGGWGLVNEISDSYIADDGQAGLGSNDACANSDDAFGFGGFCMSDLVTAWEGFPFAGLLRGILGSAVYVSFVWWLYRKVRASVGEPVESVEGSDDL